ncbi:hypothetical protein FNH05_02615 [Amycolatopsis rhizosphaerae]|uniref:Uncharacterized protein n=1 Tax=Amycolatopsis rhizosphaerae TaxID=2053003 RepID=A0A558DKN2_9PSEU|nr:hypothetical protein [Amycolatopsis rhizosphaerae]TVT61579.1 hypothetical protein FNH05_02615 [Amycolatopsis rhizosphaerae]
MAVAAAIATLAAGGAVANASIPGSGSTVNPAVGSAVRSAVQTSDDEITTSDVTAVSLVDVQVTLENGPVSEGPSRG